MTAPQPPPDGAGRAEFEAEARERGYENLRRRNDGAGRYEIAELEEAWHFWQAARSRPASPAPMDLRVHADGTDCGDYNCSRGHYDVPNPDWRPASPAAAGEQTVALLRRVADYFTAAKMGEPDAYHNPGGIKELRAAIEAYLREQTKDPVRDRPVGESDGGCGPRSVRASWDSSTALRAAGVTYSLLELEAMYAAACRYEAAGGTDQREPMDAEFTFFRREAGEVQHDEGEQPNPRGIYMADADCPVESVLPVITYADEGVPVRSKRP